MNAAPSRILFVNLPNPRIVTRRYMCSYNSPMSLFPPYELLSLAGVARQRKGTAVGLIDAVAEHLDRTEFLDRIEAFAPDLLVTISGFECFAEDMEEIDALKRRWPRRPVALFGHYPTMFPGEVLANTKVDFVILGEPDDTFNGLCDALAGSGEFSDLPGLVARGVQSPTNVAQRLVHVRDLPLPAFDLLPAGAYGEPAMAQPFGMVQAARGCPYPCNYCVRSYGTKLTLKSPDQVIAEIAELVRVRGIRSLRFIDDTFTANKKWTLEVCQAIRESGFDFEWSCLTRTDALDDQLLAEMVRAGCRRIYFGVESGSQRILDAYSKRIRADEALTTLLSCRDHGIETSAFFLLGHPDETESDFELTVEFARAAKLTYAVIETLTLYPGTPLFERYRDEIEFSLFPYRNRFRDPAIADQAERWTREFYRRFYFRPQYPLQNLRAFARSPRSLLRYALSAMQYAVLERTGVDNPFANIEPPRISESNEH